MNFTELASKHLLKHLDRERFLAVRDFYIGARNKLMPLMIKYHGTFDSGALIADIDRRIGSDFDILMVHSSFNHMTPMYSGTALELVNALIDYCGPDRTLVMPAFNFGEAALGGALGTFRDRPFFDVRRTPSQMGLVSELFRRSKSVVQSRHPVYRLAALGPRAGELVDGHELAPSGMGKNSPFDYMANHKTQIIGIGKTFQVMTQAHHVEALMGEEFPVPSSGEEFLCVQVKEGDNSISVEIGGRRLSWEFDIWKLRKLMDAASLVEWKFHGVQMFATTAGTVTRQLVAAAGRGVTLYRNPAGVRF
jgi:aminoglycoside N3'-acetyltransferase